MKSRYLAILLLLLSCSGTTPLSAQPAPLPPAPTPVVPPKPPAPKPAPKVKPVAMLAGPEAPVATGKSVWISTAGTIGNSPRFACSPADAVWRLVKVVANDDPSKETLTIHFEPEKNGTYVFSMAVNLNNETALTLCPVTVGGSPKPVDPVIPVDPVVPLPAGKYGLAPLAFQWGSSVASANRVAEAKLLANIYRTKAGELAATSKDAQTAIVEARAEAKAAMGSSDEAWRTGFWVKAGAKLAELKITSKIDCAQAFDELKNGLEAVK